MDTVACSDGANGLASRFPTFGSIPTFPNIGAAFTIPGLNSPNCGTCYQITYEGQSSYVTAVDHASDGFVLSQEALSTLTNGLTDQLGRVTADYIQVDISNCGL
ncbi:hypothetical protein RUND412_009576 [Rhizina undulata]